MVEDAALGELDAAMEACLIPLRAGKGLDEAAAERLKQALRAAARAWADLDVIPRLAANIFVDLQRAVEAVGDAYPGEEGAAIRRFAWELGDLVDGCVALR